jgi:hypothetical protein
VCLAQFESVGKDSLAFRLLQTGAKPCIVTVRYGKTGVAILKLTPSENPDILAVVGAGGAAMPGTTAPSAQLAGSATPAARELGREDIVDKRIDYSAEDLMAILCRAKERKFLQTVNPSLYTGWTERNNLALSAMSGQVRSTITEIQRWPEKDAVILTGHLLNTGSAGVSFDPKDVTVGLGKRVYQARLTDCSGVVNPGGSTAITVILQGNLEGGREHLSVENDYHIILPGSVGSTRPAEAESVGKEPRPRQTAAAFPYERIYGKPWRTELAAQTQTDTQDTP